MTTLIGILIDAGPRPRWVNLAARATAQAKGVEILWVRQVSGSRPRPRRNPLLEFYRRLDAWRFATSPDPLAIEQDPPLDGSPCLESGPEGSVVLAEGADSVLQAEVTAVLNLSSFEWPTDGPMPRLGIWRLYQGKFTEPNHDAGLVEFILGHDVMPVGLARVAGPRSTNIEVLRETHLAVDPFSLWRGRAASVNRAAQLPRRYLEGRGDSPDRETIDLCGPRPPAKPPIVRHLPRLVARLTKRAFRQWLPRERWHLATGEATSGPLRVLPSPRDVFRADPFPIRVGEDLWLFFEEYPDATLRGRIAAARLDERTGQLGRSRVVLEEPHHLSYPFVFRWDGTLWLLPEAAESAGLDLYRCVDFPDTWVWHARLIDGLRVADPTLLEHNGLWWLFASVAHDGFSLDDELHLFWADTPTGPWEPHARNPVKSDVRSARPAGRVFWSGDRLIRPAQDCAGRYGRALVFNEIDVLTRTAYRERVTGRCPPRPPAIGIHTYNRYGSVSGDERAVVDVFMADRALKRATRVGLR